MMLPTIHMNGTSGKDLLKGYCNAISAIHAALDAMELIAPNGRDYYPQGNDACEAAIREHSRRWQAMVGVLNELQVLAEHVADRQK